MRGLDRPDQAEVDAMRMPRTRQSCTAFAVAAVTLTVQGSVLAPGAVSAGTLTQAQCLGVGASVSVFQPGGVPGQDWREELVFDGHGGMWVSDQQRNVVERYDSSGRVTTTVAVPGAGG